MKLTEQLILNSVISFIPQELGEDRLSTAINLYKKDQAAKGPLEIILPSILDALKDYRREASRGKIDNKTQRRFDDAILKLSNTMNKLGIKSISRPFDVNP